MKKILLITLLLGGCSDINSTIDAESNTDKSSSKPVNTKVESSGENLTSFVKIGEVEIDSKIIDIVEDESTKCQYIYESKVAQIFSLSPYYDEFGNVKGCKSQK